MNCVGLWVKFFRRVAAVGAMMEGFVTVNRVFGRFCGGIQYTVRWRVKDSFSLVRALVKEKKNPHKLKRSKYETFFLKNDEFT